MHSFSFTCGKYSRINLSFFNEFKPYVKVFVMKKAVF